MTRIYLDNCCYSRPYDDQTQIRISLESQAKLEIQDRITRDELELVSSLFIRYENSMKQNTFVRDHIEYFISRHTTTYIGVDKIPVLEPLILEIMSSGIKPMDASHLASAIIAGCDYFITTDDRILRYKTNRIRIVDPTTFIRSEE